MRYQRSLEIEQRLNAVLELICSGDHSTPALAEKMGVSIPTISCCAEALRERGHRIKTVKGPRGWRYTVISAESCKDDSLESVLQDVGGDQRTPRRSGNPSALTPRIRHAVPRHAIALRRDQTADGKLAHCVSEVDKEASV